MVNRVHVIDPDVRRRASVSHELNSFSFHAEIYEDIYEFLDVAPKAGLVLAANGSEPHGQQLAKFIKMPGIYLPIIGYAEEPSTEEVVEAMMAGAAGFLQWPFGKRELINALSRLSEESEQRLRRERLLSQARAKVDTLSPREREVLAALIGGLSNKQIGKMLEISPRTVEIHRSNMMTKLRARSIADAVKTGLYAGLDEDLNNLHYDEAA